MPKFADHVEKRGPHMSFLYQLADGFFFTFHVGLILFNLFGWIFKPTRRWNLLTLGLTAFSWFILGIFFGFGYCFLTDWHWAVREKLGYANLHHSYIHFLVETLFGIRVSESVVDWATGIFFVAAVTMSVISNVSWRKHRPDDKESARSDRRI